MLLSDPVLHFFSCLQQEPEVTQSTIKSPTLKSRKKKRKSRKWSASKGEAPAAAGKEKEKEKEEHVDSATEVPPASGVQVNNFTKYWK